MARRSHGTKTPGRIRLDAILARGRALAARLDRAVPGAGDRLRIEIATGVAAIVERHKDSLTSTNTPGGRR